MKLFAVVFIAIGSISLLGCADDKPAPKPVASAAPAAAKPAPSAAKPAGGW